jgi:hypothetical protein
MDPRATLLELEAGLELVSLASGRAKTRWWSVCLEHKNTLAEWRAKGGFMPENWRAEFPRASKCIGKTYAFS